MAEGPSAAESSSADESSGAVTPPRQQHPRVDTRMRVRISTVDPETDPEGKPFFRTCEERCFDISRGGTFVMTPDPIEPGLRVLLELDIPGGDTVQTLGRVVWKSLDSSGSKPAGIGVEFLGGRSGQFTELERHLARARRWSAARRVDSHSTPLLQEIV